MIYRPDVIFSIGQLRQLECPWNVSWVWIRKLKEKYWMDKVVEKSIEWWKGIWVEERVF